MISVPECWALRTLFLFCAVTAGFDFVTTYGAPPPALALPAMPKPTVNIAKAAAAVIRVLIMPSSKLRPSIS